MIDFELIPHTADIKIRVYGISKEQLFLHALQGMFHVLGPTALGCVYRNDRLVCQSYTVQHDIVITALDVDSLLVDFLSEALYLSDVHNYIYLDMKMHIFSDRQLHATVYGLPVISFEIAELKAVTYHDLHIQQITGIWQTDIVFDI